MMISGAVAYLSPGIWRGERNSNRRCSAYGSFELITRNTQIPEIRAEQVIAVINEIAAAASSQEGMIGGQVMDLAAENETIDLSTLQSLHSMKTGALFVASLRAGALLGDMDSKGLQDLTTYARHFGLAFQITDDLLDIKGDQSILE